MNLAVHEKAKVLVVEDNPLVQDVLANLLEEENFNVVTSNNGEEAVDALKQSVADIIICDVMMPKMDGYMFHSLLQQSDEYSEIPFIFLTALGESKDRQKGRESGADAYLIKPFDPQELVATIKGRLAKRKKQQEHNFAKEEKFKNQVLRQLTHELRTPLVSVKTGSEFLIQQQDNLSKDKVKSLLNSICKGGQRLEALVNNFVILQKIQSGQAKDKYQQSAISLDINQWLTEYMNRQGKILEKDGFVVNYESTAEDIEILVCTEHLEIILDRLLENAVKFSSKLKQIDCSLKQSDNRVEISIRDYGTGLEDESLKHLGETFYQHNRDQKEQQGVGLGLAIIKFLTRINQGRIIMENSEHGALARLSFYEREIGS